MISWFLPADIISWLALAGMVAALVVAILLNNPLARMGLALVVILALSFQIHRHGVLQERAKWEAAQEREWKRQVEVERVTTEEANRDIAARQAKLKELDDEIAAALAKVKAAKGADAPVFDRDAINWLNGQRVRPR